MNDKEPQPEGDLPPIEPDIQPAEIRTYEKTPTFTAMNALRYQRQALIREIERENPRLLCYVAHLNAQLDRSDALGFVDLLHNVQHGEPLDLLLHTPGGDVDATEKLITMLRASG